LSTESEIKNSCNQQMGGLTGPEAFNLEISSVEMKGKEYQGTRFIFSQAV